MNEFNWKEAINFTADLSRINSYLAEGKHQAVDYVKQLLESRTNADVTVYDSDTDEPFIVARIGKKNGSFRLLVDGHLDVVSAEGMDDAFSTRIEDGIMHGRGVCDMKGGCGAMLSAFIAAASEPEGSGEIYLMLSTDEEYAGEEIKKALREGYIPQVDFALIAEPSDCIIRSAHKGEAWVKAEFFGKSAHSSTPFMGKNAIYMAASFIEEMRVHMQEYDVRGSERFGTPTISIGTIEGGSTPNVVPPYASLMADVRYLPGENAEEYVADMQKVMDICKAKWSDFDGKLTLVGNWNSMLTDESTELFARIHKALGDGFGKMPEIGVMTGWGEGGFINMHNIPTVYFGPGDMKYAHAPNEFIPVGEISAVAKAYFSVMKNICE